MKTINTVISSGGRIAATLALATGLTMAPMTAVADEIIWGNFTVLHGDTTPVTTLTVPSTIVHVHSESNYYCIWGRPNGTWGPVYDPVICGGRDLPGIEGTVLQPGNYWLLAENDDPPRIVTVNITLTP